MFEPSPQYSGRDAPQTVAPVDEIGHPSQCHLYQLRSACGTRAERTAAFPFDAGRAVSMRRPLRRER